MADTGESDGLENIDYDNRTSPEHSPAETCPPAGAHGHMPYIAASVSASKYLRMDQDDDGAPTSSQTATKQQREQYNMDGSETRERVVSFDSSAESTPRKSPRKIKPSSSSQQVSPQGPDLSLLDMKSSWDGNTASGGSSKGETTGGKTGYEVIIKCQGGMLADPVKIAKEREKEERVRQARERLLEERQKKLEELKEQQKMAQENREKQLEMRRKKIEDLRKRDIERRIAVEERRKRKEEVERVRRESILQKAEERVARYEAWKAGGRKGGRGHVLGFGSATPRDICQPLERPRRSSSQSALQRRSPNGSDMDSVHPQRRALSACSVVRRHVDSNRIGSFSGGDHPPKQLSVSTSVLYAKSSREYSSMNTLHPPSRLGTSMGTASTSSQAPAATHYYPRPMIVGQGICLLSGASMTASLPSPVRLKDNKSPRKPRPASVASCCMPSFVGGEPAVSSRSKSTDRTGRDRSRSRPPRKEDAAGKSRDDEKSQKQDQTDESGEKTHDLDGAKEHGEKKEKKERVSLSFFSRSSAPKQASKEAGSKKDATPIIRLLSPRKAYSTSNLATMKKRSSLREKQSPTNTKDSGPKTGPSAHRGSTPTSVGPSPALPGAAIRATSPARKEADKHAVRMASPIQKGGERSTTPTPFITPPPSATSTPVVPSPATLVTSSSATTLQSLTTSTSDDGTIVSRAAGGPAQDISADEYKARLAEKRRQAREKAEKEAEEERRRQEEARLADEERQRQEEEEEIRLEEEALHMAEEAQRVEGERLQKAIDAEEKRRKYEIEKHEQEKKAKEEADRKAKAEMERLEKEKQERARKEDEERLERKKKLEIIMRRVKTDTDSQPKVASPTKPVNIFPSGTRFGSSRNSPDEEHEKSVVPDDASDEEGNGLTVAEGTAVHVYSDAMTMSFMQDMEDVDMTVSTSSSTSTVTRSMLSGDILDMPSFRSEGWVHGGDERMSRSIGSTQSKPLEITGASVTSQRLDEERVHIEREEMKRRGDAEKVEQERIALQKADAERKARPETNHIETEKQVRARRDEEERLERKKKLEMIMKRVKADTDSQPKMTSSTVSVGNLPRVTHLSSSSQSSPDEEHEKSVVSEVSDEEANGLPVAEGAVVHVYSDAMTMSFMQDMEDVDMTASTSSSTSTVTRSMSSGDILDVPSSRSEGQDHGGDERMSHSAGTTPSKPEEKAISSETPTETKSKFKSPLLQHLVENRGVDSDPPKFKSPLLQNLLGKTKVGARMGLSASMGDLNRSRDTSSPQSQAASLGNTHMTLSTSSMVRNGSPKEAFVRERSDDVRGVQPSPEYEQVPKTFDSYKFTNGIGRDSGDARLPASSSKSSFDSSPFESSKLFIPLMSDSALGSSIEPHGDGLMSQSIITNGQGNYTSHGLEDSSISLYSGEEAVTKSASLTPFETLVESGRQDEAPPNQSDGQFGELIDFSGPPIRAFEDRRPDFTDYLS